MLIGTLAKGVWGVLITAITLWIAYAQFIMGENINRPSLMISSLISSERFHNRLGPLSHTYSVKNVGPVTAENFRITIVTKLDGKIIHEDQRDEIGDFTRTKENRYWVEIHDEDVAGVDFTDSEIIEEIVLEYQGGRGLKFWCRPFYTLRVTYVYVEYMGLWDYHQDIPVEESVDCR